MKEKSKFQFKGFKIKKTYVEINTEEQNELDLNFDLSGELNQDFGTFKLSMGVLIFNNDKTVNIEVVAIGDFTFNKDQEQSSLKNFLYLNSPAILFPYVRAYISTLTNLSGLKPITLPTLNFTKQKETLESNTIII